MWPFKKKQPKIDLSATSISYTQLDITNNFGDNKNISKEDWIDTAPLNARLPTPQDSGLPAKDDSDDETHAIATKMSSIRDSVSSPNDGVYCPVCHIANTDLGKLHQACPKCKRPLLRFGWD